MRNGAHSPNAICCAGCANGTGHDPECDVRNGVGEHPPGSGATLIPDEPLAAMGTGSVFFHKHDEPPFGVFSQWAASAFSEELVAGEVDDLTGGTISRTSVTDYGSAEQYVMAAKARLMGDERTFAAILAAVDPAAVKALGRAVAPYDEAT